MPIFHMSMFKVPAGVIQILESLRSKFFNGHESSGKKASWVQWKKALAPKDNGGLDVRSLRNRVLPCFWFGKKKLGNGLSTLFWDDVWCDGGKLKNRFPRAYALENSKQITVGQKLAHPSLYHSFRRHPRGGLELTQVEELAKVINPVVLTQSRILDGIQKLKKAKTDSYIDEILCITRTDFELTCYKQETNIVLWYERISSFDISKVGRDDGRLLDVQNLLTPGDDLTKPKPSNDNLKPIYGDPEALDLLRKLLHEVPALSEHLETEDANSALSGAINKIENTVFGGEWGIKVDVELRNAVEKGAHTKYNTDVKVVVNKLTGSEI
ncbi:hypothetical protein Tco_1401641 [Tanacetum coccineum]